jgi:catechol 2,3-dioxygenase-like lactoylglutathione lyase family enzyme
MTRHSNERRAKFLLCLLFYLTLSTPAMGQADAPAIVTTGAFFALSVADMQASVRWYSEKLGLKVVMRAPKTDKAAATVLEGGGLIVELVQHDDALPLSSVAPATKERMRIHGLFKAGVIVDDFEKTLAALKARGVDIAMGPFPARAGQRANVVIKDNTRNFIQLFGKR